MNESRTVNQVDQIQKRIAAVSSVDLHKSVVCLLDFHMAGRSEIGDFRAV